MARKIEIAGVPIDAVSLEGAADRLLRAAVAGDGLVVHLCNAYVLSLAADDPAYRRMLADGDFNLADGAPVAWTLRRLGVPLDGERPSGPDVFAATLARSAGTDVAHYLYGASRTTVERLTTTIARRWPGARVVGAESPPYRPLTETEYRELVERLRRSEADIVWVATGTPKQDQLIDRLRADVDAVLVAVGAAFDFVAGTRRRAPVWMRRFGLEWLFRVATEPRRLWRRYLVGNVRFLLAARRASVRSPRDETGSRRAGSRSDIHVLVVHNYVQERVVAVWRAVEAEGARLTVAGSRTGFRNPLYPPGRPVDGRSWAAFVPCAPVGWRRRGHLWWWYPGLSGLARSHEVDLIHVISEPWGIPALQAVLVARRLGIPLVLHTSSPRFDRGAWGEVTIRRWLARLVLPRVDGFASVNDSAVTEAKRHGLRNDVPVVLAQHLAPNPSSLTHARDQRGAIRRQLRIERGQFAIGFLGRLDHQKGSADLVRAAMLVTEERIRIYIAGDGPCRGDFEGAAPSNVRFLGPLDEEEVPRFLVGMDLLVVPSRTTSGLEEAYGRVVVEAAHAGTPALVSTSGHLPALVGDEASVIGQDDPNALARQLDRAASDSAFRDRLRATVSDISEKEHPRAVAGRLRGFWDEVLERPGGRRIDLRHIAHQTEQEEPR